jgi:hypothetical protein
MKTVPEALNEGGYTYELQGLYLTRQSAKAQFNYMKQRGELCDDSKYRIKWFRNIPDPSYALYIWY